MEFKLLEPARCAQIHGHAKNPVWVYKFREPTQGWTLSLATHGKPNSGKLSLGGFRIAPLARVEAPGYDNDLEAIDLAIGMEAKIYWSRLVKAGGPIGIKNLQNIVGGKCVLYPSVGSRVGEKNDMQLLDFAMAAFAEFEKRSGLYFNTGQDLGHGTLSDGKTYSLDYVNARYPSCINTDTSHPTAEGNLKLLLGMLKALDINPANAVVGFAGCGKIGGRMLESFSKLNGTALTLEPLAEKRNELGMKTGCKVYNLEEKNLFLSQPMDALVINTNGGSLAEDTANTIKANSRLRVICGSENLPFSDPETPRTLATHGKIYCPTELGGMFGYLTAAEVFYSQLHKQEFRMESMLDAANRLEHVGYEVVSALLKGNNSLTFAETVQEMYS